MNTLTLRGKTINWTGDPDFWAGFATGGWEKEMLDVFDAHIKPGDTFVDIGAWNGVCSLYAAAMGAKCYAAEPDYAAFYKLEENVKCNEFPIEVFQVAIGDKTENGIYFWSQLKQFGNSMGSLLKRQEHELLILVPSKTLNDFIYQNGIAPDFIKIDTEGSEIFIAPSFHRIPPCKIYLSLHPYWFPDFDENVKTLVDSIFPYYDVFMSDQITEEQFIAELKTMSSPSVLLIPKNSAE